LVRDAVEAGVGVKKVGPRSWGRPKGRFECVEGCI